MKTLFDLNKLKMCLKLWKTSSGVSNWLLACLWFLYPQDLCHNPEGTTLLPGATGIRLPDGRVVKYGTFGYWLYRRRMVAKLLPQ